MGLARLLRARDGARFRDSSVGIRDSQYQTFAGEALGLRQVEGGTPGRLAPTEDLACGGEATTAPTATLGAVAISLRSEGGADRSGGPELRANGAGPCATSEAPRIGNTRRIEPGGGGDSPGSADSDGDGDGGDDVAILGTRVDALYQKYRGRLLGEIEEQLHARANDGRSARSDTAIKIGSEQLVLHRDSREHWWRASNADVTCVFHAYEHNQWRCEVRSSAQYLARHGGRAAVDRARAIAEAVLVSVDEERVTRIDLCVDVMGLAFERVRAEHFVTPRRASIRRFVVQEHLRNIRMTGFTIGRGDTVCRVYRKLDELEQSTSPYADDVRLAEYARWAARGWQHPHEVWRVEFQLRGDVLKELAGGRLRDPSTAFDSLTAVWRYLAGAWVRLAVPGSATRRSRWRTDARWAVVQGASFGDADDGEVALRARTRSSAPARFVVNAAIRYAIWSEALKPYPLADNGAPGFVADWTEARAAAFVHEQLDVALRAAAKAAAADLISAHGAQDAAAHVIEKQNAYDARSVPRSGTRSSPRRREAR